MLAFFTRIILSCTYRGHKYMLTVAFLARVHLTNAKGFLYLFTRILHIDTSRIQQKDIAVYLLILGSRKCHLLRFLQDIFGK